MNKFEWNFEEPIKSESELKEYMKEINNSNTGFNFEVFARLWYKPENNTDVVMIELQIPTKDCIEITEDNTPCFEAYGVDNFEEYSCDEFLDCDYFNINYDTLEEQMIEYAKTMYK